MRPARALIDLSALRHNYRLARRLHGGKALAVVKANAYGHGAVRCARALAAEADGFAVAFLDEAMELRAAGIRQPILLLEGVFSIQELETAAAAGLWIVVHHEAQLRMLESTPLPQALHVWLKVNSGMNRAGFDAAATPTAWARLQALSAVASVTLMTHLARADEADERVSTRQIEVFDAATAGLPGARSVANSAGILAWPAARRDWARPGILLYGADPLPGREHGLRPVMSLHSEVFAVRELAAGAGLGYGARFVAAQPMRIGLVALGYADGYPRAVPNDTAVCVAGTASRIVGRVSMDMLTVDLTTVPHAGIGSAVELWGANVPVNEVAAAAGTISYELLCAVKRVRFEYLATDEAASSAADPRPAAG